MTDRRNQAGMHESHAVYWMFDTPISRQIIVWIQTVPEFRKCLAVTGLEECIQMRFVRCTQGRTLCQSYFPDLRSRSEPKVWGCFVLVKFCVTGHFGHKTLRHQCRSVLRHAYFRFGRVLPIRVRQAAKTVSIVFIWNCWQLLSELSTRRYYIFFIENDYTTNSVGLYSRVFTWSLTITITYSQLIA